MVHALFAKELDGEPKVRTSDNEWRPLPTEADLNSLAMQIQDLTALLNEARLEGFLAQAIKSTKLPV